MMTWYHKNNIKNKDNLLKNKIKNKLKYKHNMNKIINANKANQCQWYQIIMKSKN